MAICLALILTFYFVLLAHEVGHLLIARWCGLRAVRISVGFGPELFGLTDRYGTRWCLSLLPFGGYLTIPDDTSKFGERPFSEQAVGIRAAVYAAGVLANLGLSAGIYPLSRAVFGYGEFFPCQQCGLSIFIISLLYALSFWQAMLNLVPIPPLDGGMLFILGVEGLTRKRLSRRTVRTLCQTGLVSMILMSISAVAYLVIAAFGIV